MAKIPINLKKSVPQTQYSAEMQDPGSGQQIIAQQGRAQQKMTEAAGEVVGGMLESKAEDLYEDKTRSERISFETQRMNLAAEAQRQMNEASSTDEVNQIVEETNKQLQSWADKNITTSDANIYARKELPRFRNAIKQDAAAKVQDIEKANFEASVNEFSRQQNENMQWQDLDGSLNDKKRAVRENLQRLRNTAKESGLMTDEQAAEWYKTKLISSEYNLALKGMQNIGTAQNPKQAKERAEKLKQRIKEDDAFSHLTEDNKTELEGKVNTAVEDYKNAYEQQRADLKDRLAGEIVSDDTQVTQDHLDTYLERGHIDMNEYKALTSFRENHKERMQGKKPDSEQTPTQKTETYATLTDEISRYTGGMDEYNKVQNEIIKASEKLGFNKSKQLLDDLRNKFDDVQGNPQLNQNQKEIYDAVQGAIYDEDTSVYMVQEALTTDEQEEYWFSKGDAGPDKKLETEGRVRLRSYMHQKIREGSFETITDAIDHMKQVLAPAKQRVAQMSLRERLAYMRKEEGKQGSARDQMDELPEIFKPGK